MTTTETNSKKRLTVKFIAITGILSALAAVIQMFEIPLPMIIPAFVKLDFSEIPAILATFLVSPISGIIVCLIKNVIHVLTSNSAGIGELANFLLGCFMVLPAGIIYKLKPTKANAAVAMAVGAVTSGVVSIFVNYYISYPFYTQLMPMDKIIEAYTALNGGVGSLWDCLIWFNMPFTIVKFLIDSLVVFFIYKPISKAIKNI